MDSERKDVRRKKRRGAMAAGIFVIMYIIFEIAAAVAIWSFVEDAIPMAVLLIALLLSAVVVTCVIVVLIRRMKEIEGGEEDEAAQY